MIKERIIQVIDFKGIAKEKFFEKIGMTSANFRGKAKETPLNSTAIENILSEIPDIDLRWLITGKGQMLAAETIRNTDSRPIIEISPSAKANTLITDHKASAGFGLTLENPKKLEQLPAITLPNAPLGLNIAFQIIGDSMHPTVRHLDYVAGNKIDNLQDVRDGYTYIVVDADDGILYKRLYKEGKNVRIVSDNSDYPPYIREPKYILAYFKAFCRLSFDFRTYHDDLRLDIIKLNHEIGIIKSEMIEFRKNK